jgi:hypothetical protein
MEDDLRRYFGELMKQEGEIPSEALAVLGKLIRLTIEFRDQWKKENNESLTVEETRAAIEIYLTVVKTGLLPNRLEEKIDRLVRLWLKEINGKTYNG